MSDPAVESQEEQPATERYSDGAEAYEVSRLEGVFLRFGTIGELLVMLARGGRWWMLPMVSVLTVVGLLLVFLQSVQYVAPFIYAVF